MLSRALVLATALLAGALLSPAVRPAALRQAPERKLLFVSNRGGVEQLNLFTMNPDGSGQASLTRGKALQLDPAWSPDGKLIAFAEVTDYDQRLAEVYVISADGSGRRSLAGKMGGLAGCPSWSPDGKRLVFSVSRMEVLNLKGAIHTVDADGKNLRKIGDGLTPAWSPDGKRILFTHIGTTPQGYDTLALAVMDADGKNVRTITAGSNGFGGAWSPDGKRIAFSDEGKDRLSDLFLSDPDGKNRARVTETPDGEYTPHWSADGKRLNFTRVPPPYDPLKMEIGVVDLDGKNYRSLTNNQALDHLGGDPMLLMIYYGPVRVEP